MNILYVVFVNEKPVWKKIFKKIHQRIRAWRKNGQFGETFRHSKAANRGALLKMMLLKISQISQVNTYVGVCF